jgi:putative membrane protein
MAHDLLETTIGLIETLKCELNSYALPAMEEFMSKRITYMIVFLLLTAGTAFTQHQVHSSDEPGQMTKSRQLHSTDESDQMAKSQQDKMHKDSKSKMQQGNMKLASDDKKFVMKAADAGMAEVEMGLLALRQASSDEVKQFAQRMVDEHGKANTELTQLAQSKGITLPAVAVMGAVDNINDSATTPTGQQITGAIGQQKAGMEQQNDRAGLTPVHNTSSKSMKENAGHKKMMDKMSKLSGADFDREYMKHQVNDHNKAVALFERQSRSGKDAELKAFAGRTLPTLKEHQQMAREINSRVSGKTNASAKMGK